MRLIVVALLGIEITIIALASAASAATHPEGSPVQGSLYEVGQHTWEDAPALAAVLTDPYEVGPRLAGAWDLDRFALGRGNLDAVRGWPRLGARRPTGLKHPHGSRTDQPVLDGPGTDLPPLDGPTTDLPPLDGPRTGRPLLDGPRTDRAATNQTHVDWTDVDGAHAGWGDLNRARPDQAWTTYEHRPAADPRTVRPRKDVARAEKARTRSKATKAGKRPARTGVAKMPHTRSHVAHRRAQVDLTRVLPRTAAVHMSHATAHGWLQSAGLRTRSTGNCTSKHMHHCTSLDRVRTRTIAKVIQLKRESGCPIMVTGGTERGHASGHFSHGNGYKLDISHNACIDRHITKNHDKVGARSDGARIYKSDSGTTFFDESDHWDILFR
ncbi:hypothetical protein [Nonomuraea fuscirosea]|uniref:hypothetical protein n=1 Tax=Nonomuraea fuscirosea TaxID=1291556 RepID=UPI0034457E45